MKVPCDCSFREKNLRSFKRKKQKQSHKNHPNVPLLVLSSFPRLFLSKNPQPHAICLIAQGIHTTTERQLGCQDPGDLPLARERSPGEAAKRGGYRFRFKKGGNHQQKTFFLGGALKEAGKINIYICLLGRPQRI